MGFDKLGRFSTNFDKREHYYTVITEEPPLDTSDNQNTEIYTLPTLSRHSGGSFIEIDCLGNRIPRPMNAFMIFANQHRPKLRARMPGLTNKEISVKLGEIWSNMTSEQKDVYFRKSKQEEREHFQRYPDYRYIPNIVKAVRDTRPPEELHPRYMMDDHDSAEQDYYEQYLQERSYTPSTEYQMSKKKQPTAPSVFQIPRPRRLKQSEQQLDQDQYQDHDEDPPESQSYNYPYSSRQPPFSSRFIQSVYRQTTRNRYNQTPSEREQLTMRPQPERPPYIGGSRERSEYHIRKHEGYHRTRNKYHEVTDNYINQGSNLDLDVEEGLLDDECRRAVESITSQLQEDPESSNNSITDEETNYVMIPCDVNIARMLGWPVHMLQRVSQSMLERIQAESVRSLELQLGSRTAGNATQPSPDSFTEPSSTQSPPKSSSHTKLENAKDPQVYTTDETGESAAKRRCIKESPSEKNEIIARTEPPSDKTDVPASSEKQANGEESTTTKSNTTNCESDMRVNHIKVQKTKESKSSKMAGEKQQTERLFRKNIEYPLYASGVAEKDNKMPCPMDSDFKVFPSSESEDELESIDTSYMSASFGHLDSESIAAYQLSNSQGSDKIASYV